MGFTMDRYTGVFYAWLRCRCLDSDRTLGNDSPAGAFIGNKPDSVRAFRVFAVNSADAAGLDIRRPDGLELFFNAASLFTARDIAGDVYIFEKGEGC